MPEESQVHAALETGRNAVNLVRDGLLLLLLLMLLLIPGRVNDLLSKAGFTHASIFGFDWEKQMEAAAQETEEAKREAQQLKVQLGAYATRLDQFAQTVAEPVAKSRAHALAEDARRSQSAAESLGSRLGQNLAVQRDLKAELRSRIVSRPSR